jgi:hypothetical protein
MLSRVAGVAIFFACAPLLLHAQEAPASLTGSLQYGDGAALEGGSAILESPAGAAYQAKVDEQGAFRFSGLRAGKYTLSLQRLAFYGVKVKLDLLVGEQRILPPIRLSLAPAGDCFPIDTEPERSRFLSAGPSLGGLTGNLASGPAPAAGVRVSLACWGPSQCRGDSQVAITDSQGNFEFESLRPGRYSMNAAQIGVFPLSTRVDVAGGLESFYSFKFTLCPNGDCTVKPDPNVRPIVCE